MRNGTKSKSKYGLRMATSKVIQIYHQLSFPKGVCGLKTPGEIVFTPFDAS